MGNRRHVRGRVAIVFALTSLRFFFGDGGLTPIAAQVVSQSTEVAIPWVPEGHDHPHDTGDGPFRPLANHQMALPAGASVSSDEIVRVTITEAPKPPPPPPQPQPLVIPTDPSQWFSPSGRNAGTEGIANALATLALTDNKPLYISDVWGRTTGSEASDHHVSQAASWAVDLAVRGIQQPTPATHEAARRIASALGEPDWPGGNMTKTIDGYRIQVLWLVAGHFNHVHVGIRKV